MRIISQFHDYYDTVMTHGINHDLLYIRKKTTSNDKDYPYKEINKIIEPIVNIKRHLPKDITVRKEFSPNSNVSRIKLNSGIIGFCGKLYFIITIPCISNYRNGICINTKDMIFYNSKSISKQLPDEYLKKEQLTREQIENCLLDKYKTYNKWSYDLTHKIWNDLIDEYRNKKFDDIFIKLKSPIFLLYNDEFVINPCLRDLSFQKIKTPPECFQEISMYLGNQLIENKEPTPMNVSDEDMIYKKGYDKWSFRTHTLDSKKNKR